MGLKPLERTIRPYQELDWAEAEVTARFETDHGEQSQIDFGECFVSIVGDRIKIYFLVETLEYSRRIYVRAFIEERRDSCFAGMERAFYQLSGVTGVVLLDNSKAL